jgi:hypothetical protein
VGVGPLAELPDWYWDVPYDGSCAPGVTDLADLRHGANCQVWAYGVLAWFGLEVPMLRSDELWNDVSATRRVDIPEPLDLVLYNHVDDPFGAHVGLWTGAGVAHLCREVGRPVVWSESEIMSRPRYATRIGIKRAL